MKKIIAAVVVLIIVIAGIWYVASNKDKVRTPKTIEPLDVTLGFYNDWLEALSTSTGKTASDLLATTTVTDTVRNALLGIAGDNINNVKSTIFCGETLPSRVRAKVVYEEASSTAEIILISKYENASSTNILPLVKLTYEAPFWRINDISCSAGDVAPAGEFDFMQTGQLLRQVPAPYNSNDWHLVYSEGGRQGFVAVLQFTPESRCTMNGTTTPCDPMSLRETATAQVNGTATETGINVISLTMTE